MTVCVVGAEPKVTTESVLRSGLDGFVVAG